MLSVLRRPKSLLAKAKRRPAFVAAAVCGLITVWAVVMHETTSVATEWMPHIAAGAATIALTVTLVDLILRREAEERLRPWRELVYLKAENALWECVEWIALDYAETHLASFKEIPTDGVGLLDHWLAEQPNEDSERPPGRPRLLEETAALLKVMLGLRRSDQGVIAPELIRAIDDVAENDRWAQLDWVEARSYPKLARYETRQQQEERLEKRRKDSLECAVKGVRHLTDVLLRVDGEAKMPERIALSATSAHYAILAGLVEGSRGGSRGTDLSPAEGDDV